MIVEEKEFQCNASGGSFEECDNNGCSNCKYSSSNNEKVKCKFCKKEIEWNKVHICNSQNSDKGKKE